MEVIVYMTILKKLIGGATKNNLLELRICAVRYDAAAWCRGTYFALLPE
jgi:hypothetical protein